MNLFLSNSLESIDKAILLIFDEIIGKSQNNLQINIFYEDSRIVYTLNYDVNIKNCIINITDWSMITQNELLSLSILLNNCNNISLSIKYDHYEFSDNGAESLCNGIKNFPKLYYLSLDLKGYGNTYITSLSNAFSNMTNINSLSLELSSINIGNEQANILANGLSKLINVNTLYLNLSYNGWLDGNGASSIAKGLSMLTNMNSLILHIHNTQFGTGGAGEILGLLKKLTKLSYLDLDVSQNCQEYDFTLCAKISSEIPTITEQKCRE